MAMPEGHVILEEAIDELFMDELFIEEPFIDDIVDMGIGDAANVGAAKARNATLATSDAMIRFMSSVLIWR